MNDKVTEENSLAWKADAAFLKASYKVVQRAKETGTPVIIWEDDRIKEIPPDEMEMRMNAAYPTDSTL
jgi:hypothetical protein